MDQKIALTGIKPTGSPHIGNYLGMIKPALELAEDYQALYFIADYHALTTVKNQKELSGLIYEVAATWLALGLDPERVVFYRQADIPELFEFSWILSCFTSKGLLNRAHAYKTIVDENVRLEREPDQGINTGLYTYPVLMAADILLFGSHAVPVGLDQKQHIEITRDIAQNFNNTYREILTIPEALIKEEVMTIPGLDGRKMSKSYNNTIPIFVPPNQLRKFVMRIVTNSQRPEEPKDPETCNVFSIYRYFAPPETVEATRQRYLQGGLAYSEIKEELFELLNDTFRHARSQYDDLVKDRRGLDEILLEGADKASRISRRMMDKVRRAIGIRSGRG